MPIAAVGVAAFAIGAAVAPEAIATFAFVAAVGATVGAVGAVRRTACIFTAALLTGENNETAR